MFGNTKFSAMHEGKVVETGVIERLSDRGGTGLVRINDRWFSEQDVRPAA